MLNNIKFGKKNKTPQPAATPAQPQEEIKMQPQQYQPETLPAEASEPPSVASSTPHEAPTHFDELIAGAPSAPIGSAEPAAAVMLPREDFHKMFIGGFKAGHALTGLKSLDIGAERQPAAQECAYALYDSIVDIPSLHFMLQPTNKWWGRVIAIGVFTVPTAISLRAELIERRRGGGASNFSTAKAATRPAASEDGDPDLAAATAFGAVQ